MRVKEEFKKSGYFSIPSMLDVKVAGTLSITDGGHIELELFGLLPKTNNADDDGQLDRIIGYIEGDKLVTLDDCFYTLKPYGLNEISKSLICANKVFISVAYEKEEIVSFNKVLFSIEGIDEWVGISGIQVPDPFAERNVTITYDPPEEISINLNNGMQLVITFSWTPPSLPCLTKAEITQKTYFKLVCAEEKELNEFNSVIHKITTLLCFGIDKIVCLNSLEATSNNLYQEFDSGRLKYYTPIKIYYSSLPYCEYEAKIYSQRMLFTFGQIKDNFEKMVNRWIDAYDKIDVVFSLYFSTKMEHQKYLDGKFLALAQALETYHRRNISDKKMDFRDRIKNLIDEPLKDIIGDSLEWTETIEQIVKTRNYLTHYNQKLENAAVGGMDLYPLCQKIETIFQLHFLDVLGFTKDEIQSIL